MIQLPDIEFFWKQLFSSRAKGNIGGADGDGAAYGIIDDNDDGGDGGDEKAGEVVMEATEAVTDDHAQCEHLQLCRWARSSSSLFYAWTQWS